MPLEISRIRALCFDIDGTLSDTDDQYVQRLAGWLNPFQSLLPGKNPQAVARRIVMAIESPGNVLFSLPDRLNIDDQLASIGHALLRLGRHNHHPKYLLVAGVREMLAKLSERYPLAVVSARGERSSLLFLDQFGLRPYFQFVATARTCRHTKPYPDQILWAAQHMGVDPGACLMVGDTSVDIRAGKAAGAQTVGVLCGFGQEKELHRQGADLILPTTPHLADILLTVT
jgi:phosphoglycolate phosphatase-like HAD superfamily hydrolase